MVTSGTTKRLLDVRKDTEVHMDALSAGPWKSGDMVYTQGLSACTVMAIWDHDHFIMCHIPPARVSGPSHTLSFMSLDIIAQYKDRMTSRFKSAIMKNPQGYLLVNSMMGAEEKQALHQWFTQDAKITPTIKEYTKNDYQQGKGQFNVSRKHNAWPPKITFE